MHISINGFIAPKEAELFDDCADRYALNTDLHKFAISDGVSKSFFPKIWADVLVKQWVSKNWNTKDEFISQSQEEWLERVTEIASKPEVKWFTKNAFNRKEPGLATFVGLRFFKKKKAWFWRANALGDSFLFFIPKSSKSFSNNCIKLSSKKEPVSFDNFPDYIGSIGNIHEGEEQSRDNQKLSAGTFYLMTDALAEWFLDENENALTKISTWHSQKDFEHFVSEERLSGKLNNDDSAILVITIEDLKHNKPSYNFKNVTDINEIIKKEQLQREITKKNKEQVTRNIKETDKSELASDQVEQEDVTIEGKYSKGTKAKLENPKKGLIVKIAELIRGSEESEPTIKRARLETNEKKGKQEEKESTSQEKEVNTEIETAEGSENNQQKESTPKNSEEPKGKTNLPEKPSKNITDKF